MTYLFSAFHTPFQPRRRTLLSALLGSGVLAACGGSSDKPVAESAVTAQARSAVSKGLVGAVIASQDLSSRRIGVAGVRRLGQSAPLQSTDLMCIGSNTKAMSACVIARLVADGRVRWDTTILDALPDLAGELRGEYATVTLAHLLDHKGGMLAFTGMEGDEERFMADLSARNETLPDTLSGRRRFFARWLVSQAVPAGVTPTRDFHYSNAGYALAACMLEALTARSFEAHFEEYMVQSLGVQGTWQHPSAVSAQQPNGHTGRAGALRAYAPEDVDTEAWLAVIAPAGGWACRPDDYCTWLRWHLLALQGQDTPLPGTYVQRLKGMGSQEYALGWLTTGLNGKPVLAHTGAHNGFMAIAALERSGRRASYGLTNTADTGADGASWVMSLLNTALIKLDELNGS